MNVNNQRDNRNALTFFQWLNNYELCQRRDSKNCHNINKRIIDGSLSCFKEV
ncbi:MAG: hypothetical protein IJE43_02140 [Alphaproteobacteria bacterium]|nr:hypothetical protein [Alphaproteobacteria bacterium]